MIKANRETKYIALYEALASEVRWRIMDLISDKERSVKEIAARLELSPSIVTLHIRKLEQAGLIGSRRVRLNGGTHKMCYLKQDKIEIELPSASSSERIREQTISVGHYTAFEVHPTCGLGTREKEIGVWDDPRYFLDPERVQASILWFGRGYVEYKTPNYLFPDQSVEAIELSMEIASEAPGLRDQWPSDITFTFNGVSLGVWTSPADFGRAARGKYTPEWWHRNVNQYGLLKTVRIDASGTFMDGEQMSDVTVLDIKLSQPFWTLRFAVEKEAVHVGGLTLYGSGFGNHDQDIRIRIYLKEESPSKQRLLDKERKAIT
ncbi:ArsR family transcriptional regulator [Paenibacillus yonginensis]|uniref:ArsR family transcriptional regulator n=1 Tax=Paenibacillus yonginensis TaxID=1462996 RepID=A0A1B1MZ81_9BACL|nr:ArsR family transcriptional regulator [Paenibacillus yonginensis]ANS74485.1 ArsR family transcriptional regulator [Paenibacillus yonginensis]